MAYCFTIGQLSYLGEISVLGYIMKWPTRSYFNCLIRVYWYYCEL